MNTASLPRKVHRYQAMAIYSGNSVCSKSIELAPSRCTCALMLLLSSLLSSSFIQAQSKPDTAPAESAISTGNLRKVPLLETKVQSLEAQTRSLAQELSQTRLELQRQNSESNSAAQSKVADLESRLARAEGELAIMASSRNSLNIMLERYGLTVSDLDNYLERSESQRENQDAAQRELSTNTELLEQTAARLAESDRLAADYLDQIRQRDAQVAELKGTISSQKTAQQELEENLELQIKERNQYQNDANAARQQKDSVANELDELERRLQIADSAKVANQGEIDALKTELFQSGEELQALKADQIRLTEQMQVLESQLQESSEQSAREPLAANENSTSAQIQESTNSSIAVPRSTGASTNEVSVSLAKLSERWAIELGPDGPLGYLGLTEAGEMNSSLPSEVDCQEFVNGYLSDTNLPEKLSVNGFPVSGFWVSRSNGALALCRISGTAGGDFRATVSRQPPSRTEKALVAVAQ